MERKFSLLCNALAAACCLGMICSANAEVEPFGVDMYVKSPGPGYHIFRGDYDWSDAYPIGAADLKSVLSKVKAAGITSGFHTLQTHIGSKSSSDFSVDYYYHKVHGRGVALFGAHTWARPVHDSSQGLFTHRDDAPTFLKLISLGRLSVDGYVADVRSPADCGDVYARLAKGGAFPITQFDWTRL